MFASKIWVVLLAALAVAGFAVASLVPKPAARQVAKAYAENLDRGQHNADLILRLEARDWIDAVAKMAWDGAIIDSLEQAGNRRGDLKSHQAKLAGRLLTLIGRTRVEARPQLLIAVDHRGKQIARIGPGERGFTPGEDGLGGYPLVEAALRGYRTDDTWSLEGKLLLMAASPVISRSRGRYVGALLVGLDIDAAFARRLKSRLAGTDLAFFLRGKLVASTTSNEGLTDLPAEFSRRADEISKHGRSAVVRLSRGAGARTAILASLPGEASEHGAFYAAVGAPVPAAGLGEMLGMLGSSDLRWGDFPWLLMIGLLVIAAVLGLALLRWEHDAPIARLLVSAEKVSRGEASRLDEYTPGALGGVARYLNEAQERLSRRTGPPSPGRESRQEESSSNLSAILAGSSKSLDSLGIKPVQPLAGITADFEAVAPPMVDLDPARDFQSTLQEEPPSRRELAALSLSSSDVAGSPPPLLEVPPVKVPDLNLSVTPSRPTGGGLAAVPSSIGGAAASFDLEPRLEPPRKVGTITATGLRAVNLPASEVAALAAAAAVPPGQASFAEPDATPVVPIATEDEHYRQVFKEFVGVKQQCGENTAALTFEKFVEKLRKNRDTLIKTYGCRSVKFQVYIKDGKAALKATPVKD